MKLGIRSRHRWWRQLVGWIAVYAFILQGILVGFAGIHLHAASGFEFCHSDPAALAPGEAPVPNDDDFHCPFCAPTGSGVAPLTGASIPAVAIAYAGLVAWPVGDAPVTSCFRSSGKRSRAPPVAA